MRPLVAGLLVLLANGVAHAEIYRCVDRQGRVLFTDAACPKGMRITSVTSSPPASALAESEQRAREEAERQQLAAIQSAQLQRIQELEDQLAALRSAPPAAAPLQESVQEVPAAAPVYPVVVLNRCRGRDSDPNHHPHGSHGQHDGHHGHGEPDGGQVPVRKPPPSQPQH